MSGTEDFRIGHKPVASSFHLEFAE